MEKTTQSVIDIETGGFSKSKNGIIEIAFVITDENNLEVDSFEAIIERYDQENGDKMIYNPHAEKVHKISGEQQKIVGIDPKKACEIIIEMLKKWNVSTFIAHNARFDMDRLKIFFDRFSPGHQIEFEDFFCTMRIAKEKVSLKSYSLESLCDHFNVKNDQAHRALSDVRSTNEVLKNLMK